MGKSKLVRNLVIAALGVIAAVAIACSGSASDDASTFGGGSTGAEDGFDRDAAGESPLATLNVTLGDKAGAPEQAQSRASAGAGGARDDGPLGGPPVLQSTVERQIVQTASMQLQVEDVGGGFEEVGRIATATGGFVASSKFSFKNEAQIASVTIRVPSDSLQSVLSQLRGLAEKVDAEDSNASDVTEEYTDLQSRLRNLQATHDQLLTLLGRAQTVTDILTVQDRLNAVTGEIEQVKGRIQLLDNLTSLATVTVHLRPVAVGGGNGGGSGVNLGETISEAWDDSLAFLGGVAEDVLTVIVFAWWVPVLGLPVAVIVWGTSRHKPRANGAVAD
ncbi:MAG TPA: DUF4349 domain-containing protein [Dehalococcoidia bacterium]|nr:DUF4349 domain-containing protein [Dehalococcoidia bacterium]